MRKISQILEASTKDLQNGIDNNVVVVLLQTALAEEFNQWYQYFIVKEFLQGPERKNIADFYANAATDELFDHIDWILKRLNELGADPGMLITPNWDGMTVNKYITPLKPFDVLTSLNQNVESEKAAISTYTKLEEVTRDKDIVSHRKIKEILADEQHHLQELLDFIKDITPVQQNQGIGALSIPTDIPLISAEAED